MKLSNILTLAALGCTAATASLHAQTKFGTIDVTQRANNNNNLSHASPGISLALGPGSSPGITLLNTSSRGDYELTFGNAPDTDNGMLITSINQLTRNDSATGGPATGAFFATSSFDRNTTGRYYWIALHWADDYDSTEVNYNVAFAYFPYSKWFGGVARNTVNNGVMTSLEGSAGLVLGTHFIDPTSSAGQYTLNINSFFPNAAQSGVLLVNGAKNEDNFAMSMANADGTYTIYCHDNSANTDTYENDGVGFVYIPVSKIGQDGLAAMGRINGDTTADVAAGNFTVTKGGTGQWYLKIPGQSPSTGTLVISPAGGDTYNLDNIVNAGWDAANERWIIESRDMSGTLGANPTLQNLEGGEDVFSFAFFSKIAFNVPPTVAMTGPANGGTSVQGAPVLLTATATDDSGVTKVEFYNGTTKLGEDTTVPYEYTWTGAAFGTHTLTVRATDGEGATSSSAAVKLTVTPPAGTDALSFDGSDDHVTFGDAAALKLSTFTLECWFRREAGGTGASTGVGGVTGIPLITKGRGQSDGSNVDCNYFFGIDEASGVLVADFEDLATGLNHPVSGATVIPVGEWQHAVATFDGTSWRIYLNGRLEAEASADGQVPRNDSIQHAAIGTAMNSTGTPEGNFAGVMDEVRIWNRARSLQEIQSAMNSQIPSATGLAARWAMDEASGNTIQSSAGAAVNGTLVNGVFRTTGAPFDANIPPIIEAVSPADGLTNVGNSTALQVTASDLDTNNIQVTFYSRKVAATSNAPDFTVVALPDTQYYSENIGGNRAAIFSAQTDWIVAQKDFLNIAFVMHLGDVTDHGDNPTTRDAEWANATNAMYRLENPSTTMLPQGIPYIMSVGNHDQYPNGDDDNGTTIYFNTFFGVHPQTGVNHFAGKSYYGGTSEPTKADNNYTLFSASGLDFIVISMEYSTSPDQADLQWADDLLKAYPNRRGIMVSHHTVNTGNPASFSIMGRAMYDALKNNPNLIMMHGGHIHGEGQRVDTFQGRAVHSILADYQSRANGGDGWLRIMTFKPSSDEIQIQTYSPTRNEYETDANSAFTISVNLSGGIGPFTQVEQVNTTGGTLLANLTNLESGTKYEWYAEVSDGTTIVSTPVRTFTTAGGTSAPTVEITGPANGAGFVAPAVIELTATAADQDGSVAKVEFFNGTEKLGEDETAPYELAWTNVSVGSYTILATATDNEGLTTTSAPISVVVAPAPDLPVVSIAATDSVGGEFGEDNTLAFTITRDGDLTNPLTVIYTVGGTATAGTDYSPLTGTVEIPANSASAVVTVSVLTDTLPEGDESISLTLATHAAYTVGTSGSATGSILDRPLDKYLHEIGLTTPNGDDDGDGVANVLEYYMGSDPLQSGHSASLEVTAAEPGTLKARYPRVKAAGDVNAAVQWSTDLTTWHASEASNGTNAAAITTTVVEDQENTEVVEAELTITSGPVPQKVFLRLNVDAAQ
jgi:hypothetical protein